MRLFKLFFLIFLITFIDKVNGQSQDKPWSFSVNSNIINLLGDNVAKGFNFGGPSVGISRHVSSGISLGTQFSLGNVSNSNDSGFQYNYNSLDGFVKVNILSSFFIPHIIAGYGFSKFSDGTERLGFFPSTETSRTVFGGVGFSFAVSEGLAINLQSTYRNMNENNGFNHFQHFAGLSYNFGSGDSDKDGVPDKKDKCPDVPGLKEFEGCPDTDGDSVIDKEDKCPEIPGIIELNGCKDSDDDGIVDPDDICPEEAGTIEMNGCPDSDGDNISDIEDECINQVGPTENKGCPWPDRDGDGINDKEDLCKDEVGTKKNNGCPELSIEIVKTLNEFGSRINFAANSYEIYGRTSLDNLAKIKILLEENPEGVLMIEGYSSADGNETYNEKLSEKRAKAVLEYLIQLGVPAERLEVIGFGEVNPIGDNDNYRGRAINRRVQFKTKQY
jgi:outer membrane protein OmpA-like peptidoglycan-associated protein